MPCYRPVLAYRSRIGKGLTFRLEDSTGEEQEIPCGRCVGCRLSRAEDWAVRITHEAQFHQVNSFVTLTYDDEHLPGDLSLNHDHFQDFMKRLRYHFRPQQIRYYMAGEYGEKYQRPHYHAILFGVHFNDRKLWKVNNGNELYTSKYLDAIWKKGFTTVGNVSHQSARYVAQYVMKKVFGKDQEEHYLRCDGQGEAYQLKPEYNQMSLKPAIGRDWFEKFKCGLYPKDYVIVEGRKQPVPGYYDRLMEAENPGLMEKVKAERRRNGWKHRENSTLERLETRKICAESRQRTKKLE